MFVVGRPEPTMSPPQEFDVTADKKFTRRELQVVLNIDVQVKVDEADDLGIATILYSFIQTGPPFAFEK